MFFFKFVVDDDRRFFFREKSLLRNKHDFTAFSNVIHPCYFPATEIEQKVRRFFCSGVHPDTQIFIRNLKICKIIRFLCLETRRGKSNCGNNEPLFYKWGVPWGVELLDSFRMKVTMMASSTTGMIQ